MWRLQRNLHHLQAMAGTEGLGGSDADRQRRCSARNEGCSCLCGGGLRRQRPEDDHRAARCGVQGTAELANSHTRACVLSRPNAQLTAFRVHATCAARHPWCAKMADMEADAAADGNLQPVRATAPSFCLARCARACAELPGALACASSPQTDTEREQFFLILRALKEGPYADADAAAAVEQARCSRRSRRSRCPPDAWRPNLRLLLQVAVARGLLPRRIAPYAPRAPDGALPTMPQTYEQARRTSRAR